VIDTSHRSLFKTLLINKGRLKDCGSAFRSWQTRASSSDHRDCGTLRGPARDPTRTATWTLSSSGTPRSGDPFQGAGSAGCNLKYISRVEEVQTGDVVRTSGLAGVSPRDCSWASSPDPPKDTGLFQKIDVARPSTSGKIEEVLALIYR